MLLGITFCLLVSKGYDHFLERQFSCGVEKGLEEIRAVRRLLKGEVTVTWTKVMQAWVERNEQF